MNEADLRLIEESLAILLPNSYKVAIQCRGILGLPEIFDQAQSIIAINLSLRKNSWLGRPIDKAFFVFGRHENTRELFLDLDWPEPPVLQADYENKGGIVVACSFPDWISITRSC